MKKAYKYRIRPTKAQQQSLQQFFGASRFVFNAALETKVTAYESNKTNLSYIDLCGQLKELKNTEEFSWLKLIPSQGLQQSIKQMINAFDGFFKEKGYPKFKNKRSNKSICTPQGVKVDFKNGKVFFPKLKWIKCHFSRTFEGKIKTCTISQTSTGKYYISILVDDGKELPKKQPIKDKTTIGIDLGIKHFAITSDKEFFENQKLLIKSLSKLRIENRSLARKVKFSQNWYDQKLRLAKLHEKITNQRKDFLHKLSTYLVKKYDTICLESLHVKGMIKNPKLAKHIADQAWGKFVTFCKYKCDWYGKNFQQISQWFPSSKLCNVCDIENDELTLAVREWTCLTCETHHDRDINAAKNIKKQGLRLIRQSIT